MTNDASVTLNANNLFDEHCYSQYRLHAGAIQGDPRNLQVTLRTSF